MCVPDWFLGASPIRRRFLFDGKHVLQVFLRFRQFGFLVFAGIAEFRELVSVRPWMHSIHGLLQFFCFGTGSPPRKPRGRLIVSLACASGIPPPRRPPRPAKGEAAAAETGRFAAPSVTFSIGLNMAFHSHRLLLSRPLPVIIHLR